MEAPSMECVCCLTFDSHGALHHHIKGQKDPIHRKIAREIAKKASLAVGGLPQKLPAFSSQPPAAEKQCACGQKFGSSEALLDHTRGKHDKFHEMILEKGFQVPKEAIEASRPPPSVPAEDAGKRKEKWLLKNVGRHLTRILSDKVKPVKAEVSSKGSCELLCSYSWTSKEHPTAYVPGEPPRFVARPVPISVPQDSGPNFIDQNIFRLPDQPFEVVFQAMQVMNRTFKFDGVDVLISRNSLRHLFNFCLGRAGKSFRIALFLVNNTLVVERSEESAKEMMIQGAGLSGYGHSFEKAVTVPPEGMEDSAGHHRVLKYNIGGLNCAVRLEVDARLAGPGEKSNTRAEGGKPTDLSSAADGEPQATDQGAATTNVEVITRGVPMPKCKAAEIKSTRLRGTGLSRLLPQLWFGRTAHLIRGHHSKGNFEEIKVDNVYHKLVAWEKRENNQLGLRKMASLLGKLRDILKNSGAKAGCAVYVNEHIADQPRVLQVFAALEDKAPLPQAIIEQFWEG
ncbi:hypothetical protein ACJZ2D_001072 [Fusarium nematophilum]